MGILVKTCCGCGKEFETNRKKQKFCTRLCRENMYEIKSFWLCNGERLPSATVGAIQELRVSVDLLKKGYEVFRALSPSASCDILVLKDKKIKTIEVRTGYEIDVNGKLQYPSKNIRADYLAIALPEKLIYIPEIE